MLLNGCGSELKKNDNDSKINKYDISTSEIWRRLSPPESINMSLLNGFLRRGKGKNIGTDMHSMLKQFGMDIRAGRRAAPTTLFTLLTESLYFSYTFKNILLNLFNF